MPYIHEKQDSRYPEYTQRDRESKAHVPQLWAYHPHQEALPLSVSFYTSIRAQSVADQLYLGM
jgi:hypothetical protein